MIVADRVITEEEALIFDYVTELTGIDDILEARSEAVKEQLKDIASQAD